MQDMGQMYIYIYLYIYNYLYIQFYVIVYTPLFVKDICITHTQVSRRLFDFAGLTDSIGGAAKWCQDTVSQVWSQALWGRGPWKTRCETVGSGMKFLLKGVELSLILTEDMRLFIMFHLLVLYKL